MVRTVLDGLVNIRLGTVQVKDLAGKDAGARDALFRITAGNARHAEAVVAGGGNDAGHVRSMALGGHNGGRVVVEVVAARTVFIAGNDVALQVLMVHVHALVHHGDNHLVAAHGKLVPDGLHVDIGILVAGIGVMPLAGEVRVVEGAGTDRKLRGNRHNARHFCE